MNWGTLALAVLLATIASSRAEPDSPCDNLEAFICAKPLWTERENTRRYSRNLISKVAGARKLLTRLFLLEREIFQSSSVSLSEVEDLFLEVQESVMASAQRRNRSSRFGRPIEFVTSFQLVTRRLDDDILALSYCGILDSSNPVIFSIREKNQREVVPCPMALAPLVTEPIEAIEELWWRFGHEVGHFVDPKGAVGTHAWPDDADIDGRHRLDEASADYWAVGALADRFEAEELSPGQVLERLRMTHARMCGTEKSDLYPSGDYRINVILGQHPQIRRLLRCPSST